MQRELLLAPKDHQTIQKLSYWTTSNQVEHNNEASRWVVSLFRRRRRRRAHTHTRERIGEHVQDIRCAMMSAELSLLARPTGATIRGLERGINSGIMCRFRFKVSDDERQSTQEHIMAS